MTFDQPRVCYKTETHVDELMKTYQMTNSVAEPTNASYIGWHQITQVGAVRLSASSWQASALLGSWRVSVLLSSWQVSVLLGSR